MNSKHYFSPSNALKTNKIHFLDRKMINFCSEKSKIQTSAGGRWWPRLYLWLLVGLTRSLSWFGVFWGRGSDFQNYNPLLFCAIVLGIPPLLLQFRAIITNDKIGIDMITKSCTLSAVHNPKLVQTLEGEFHRNKLTSRNLASVSVLFDLPMFLMLLIEWRGNSSIPIENDSDILQLGLFGFFRIKTFVTHSRCYIK